MSSLSTDKRQGSRQGSALGSVDEKTSDSYVGIGNEELGVSSSWSTRVGRDSTKASRRRSRSKTKQSLEVDHSSAVDSFFTSIRNPAAFMAAASLNELFRRFDDTETFAQSFLQASCTGLMWFAFILAMNVVVISTSALNRHLAQDFDAYAKTGYQLLYREFHFEYVCVTWSFLVSLFGFLLAVLFRVLYKAELFNVHGEDFKRNDLWLGIAICLIMFSLLLHLYSYVSSTLITWKSMLDMTVDLVKLILGRGSWENPTETISLGIACVGLVFIALAMIPEA